MTMTMTRDGGWRCELFFVLALRVSAFLRTFLAWHFFFRRAVDEVIPYDGLPRPSKVATDKDVRRTSGRFLSAARLSDFRAEGLLCQLRKLIGLKLPGRV